eukprot:CAMPEP_0182888138 /NCGR_PEP_ID=MMETSP0034_2-20130328/21256_1 /TAXON_ID=156128 /ORGANISM="Nephroselmis pyriformis, Strain CCMP717" /LENGTH=222 /DNA_ID=CAMNT_0025021549 /DNA_START=85 /DNA_END=749 /DNA_ORIENTATION=-
MGVAAGGLDSDTSSYIFALYPVAPPRIQIGERVHVVPSLCEAAKKGDAEGDREARRRGGWGFVEAADPNGKKLMIRYDGADATTCAAKVASVAPPLAHPAGLGAAPLVVVTSLTQHFRALASLLPSPGARCCEVGSAYGDATELMSRAAGPGGSVIGIDAGEKFVRRARQRFPALRFERGDALEDKALLPRLGDGAELLFIDIGGVREEPSVLEMINAAAKA